MKQVRQDAKDIIIDGIENLAGTNTCEIHNELFNTDYFIIGTYQAKEYLKNTCGVFEAIELIQEYEQDNFGEAYTELSDPEKVCNMLMYIIGEEELNNCSTIQDNWDTELTEEMIKEILEDIE